MLKNISLFLALLLSVGPVLADDAQIDALTHQISNSPHDTRLYTQRMRLYDAAGNYSAALSDLKKTCSMERDADIAELCQMEASEYAAKHNLR